MWFKKTYGLDSEKLLHDFKQKIQDIVQQVRDKLNKDAKDQELIKMILKET